MKTDDTHSFHDQLNMVQSGNIQWKQNYIYERIILSMKEYCIQLMYVIAITNSLFIHNILCNGIQHSGLVIATIRSCKEKGWHCCI